MPLGRERQRRGGLDSGGGRFSDSRGGHAGDRYGFPDRFPDRGESNSRGCFADGHRWLTGDRADACRLRRGGR